MNRSDMTYWQYVKASTEGMLTAWWRINWYWREVVEGFLAAIFVALLALVPFFFWLSPLVALVARVSDRRDARLRQRMEAEARAHYGKLRRNVWEGD
ncbi:hypothetical protein [Cupriavidus campinensis]|uniref:Uncharacterized protein n=1 Tax=Cupriavidus campinensis TaxID=151783 RepID=A0ABY3ESU1_9BURK|nr:hypothetical protein [Cupriavidus campinensis]TSP14039.1 hypothetical protein FGG12_06100 [Cupriavidus campinensis]